MNIKTNILVRVYFLFVLCAIFGIVVLGKIYAIQTYKSGYWKNLADSLTTNTFDIQADRGNIYSADDKLLATSIPYFDLYVDFASGAMKNKIFEDNVDSLSYYMWKYINKSSQEEYKRKLIKARKQKKRYFELVKNIDYQFLKKIKKWPLFREGKFKGGLIIESKQIRQLPYELLAKRTIGYTKDANFIGLEGALDSLLGGTQGKMLKQKIAGGVWIPIKSVGALEPKNGYDIITTIDLGLQDIAENTLLNALNTSQADFGCAVLMEVKTGAIKAIVNLGLTKNNTYSEIYNYAVGLSNEPGSVFKTAGYLALFDDKIITPNDSINTNYAQAKFGDKILTDDGHNTQYKFLTAKKALAISSNVAIAKWLVKNYNDDREKYYNKLVQFGLTEKTHIELQGEPSPYIKSFEKWSYMSLPWMAHGYEVKFTPLQILTFYNAIANNGNRMKPFLVQKVMDNGKVIKEILPQTTKTKICSPEAAQYVREIMLEVVEGEKGTARGIFSPYYKIAGKTGTAKMSFGSNGYSNKNLSTFVGFFPANNPLYSCIVVIGGPKGLLTTGGAISAPVFRTIADKIITSNIQNNLAFNKDSTHIKYNAPKVKSDIKTIKTIAKKMGQKPSFKDDWEYANTSIDSAKITSAKIEIKQHIVPNVKGMLLDDALYLLENTGLKVGFVGKGKVISQSLPDGLKITKGTFIQLVLN